MQRWKVGALIAALLLAASGCALESGEPERSTHEGEQVGVVNEALSEATPSGATTPGKPASGGSQQGVTAASPAGDPGQEAADNGDPGKPQPDPWKAATGGGSKPQPDPWNPGSSTVSTSADR